MIPIVILSFLLKRRASMMGLRTIELSIFLNRDCARHITVADYPNVSYDTRGCFAIFESFHGTFEFDTPEGLSCVVHVKSNIFLTNATGHSLGRFCITLHTLVPKAR